MAKFQIKTVETWEHHVLYPPIEAGQPLPVPNQWKEKAVDIYAEDDEDDDDYYFEAMMGGG